MLHSVSRAHSLIIAITLVAATLGERPSIAAPPCESLTSLTLPNTTITLAVSVAAGAFVPEKPFTEPGPPLPSYKNLPAFCRVAGTIKPTPDSDIKFEVWMPLAEWNGKFQAVGNGVW